MKKVYVDLSCIEHKKDWFFNHNCELFEQVMIDEPQYVGMIEKEDVVLFFFLSPTGSLSAYDRIKMEGGKPQISEKIYKIDTDNPNSIVEIKATEK